jgi:CO dehydrogenase maturation factor
MTSGSGPITLAVAGKGGTGKTTFAALIIRYLAERRKGQAILAVDADPNANLHEALGLTVTHFISDFIGETKNVGPMPAGMTKNQFIEYRLASAIVESDVVDLIAMGQPEGPGCYCYANDLIRGHLASLAANYDYLVLDNEAGLEHLSRRVARDVDHLFVLSDATVRGLRSAGRVRETLRELGTETGQIHLVVARVREGDLARLADEIARTGLTPAGAIPADPAVEHCDVEGRPLFALAADAPAVRAAYAILDKVLG